MVLAERIDPFTARVARGVPLLSRGTGFFRSRDTLVARLETSSVRNVRVSPIVGDKSPFGSRCSPIPP